MIQACSRTSESTVRLYLADQWCGMVVLSGLSLVLMLGCGFTPTRALGLLVPPRAPQTCRYRCRPQIGTSPSCIWIRKIPPGGAPPHGRFALRPEGRRWRIAPGERHVSRQGPLPRVAPGGAAATGGGG